MKKGDWVRAQRLLYATRKDGSDRKNVNAGSLGKVVRIDGHSKAQGSFKYYVCEWGEGRLTFSSHWDIAPLHPLEQLAQEATRTEC